MNPKVQFKAQPIAGALGLEQADPELFKILKAEDQRQEDSLEMIASENFVSSAVLEAAASTLTNKYAEGYPKKRYYNGCEYADQVEELAMQRAKELFGAKFVNVQPHSGSQANMAAFFAFLQPGDTLMGMDLSHGGHLTHGSRVNFSGRYYNIISYGLDAKTHRIDFTELARLAKEHRPKLIIAGFSAYPRLLEFEKFRQIADDVGALLLADIAHIAGLVACGEHPSPIDIADITTSTTHKTLRGPRGGIILSNTEEDAKALNSQVFPGIQGGPMMHIIAAKALAFQEARQPEFRAYIQRVKENACALAESFIKEKLDIVSGGTDNHIVLLDLQRNQISGAAAADALHEVGITANKNAVPFDPHPPRLTSGVRFGSAALTTRGLRPEDFMQIGRLVGRLLKNMEDAAVRTQVRAEVRTLTQAFPMDAFRLYPRNEIGARS